MIYYCDYIQENIQDTKSEFKALILEIIMS